MKHYMRLGSSWPGATRFLAADPKLDFIRTESCAYVKFADYLPDEVDCEDVSSEFSSFAYQHFLEAPA